MPFGKILILGGNGLLPPGGLGGVVPFGRGWPGKWKGGSLNVGKGTAVNAVGMMRIGMVGRVVGVVVGCAVGRAVGREVGREVGRV